MERHLLSLGLGHDVADIQIREQASLDAGRSAALLRNLRRLHQVDGALVLATCGRTEVYVSGVHVVSLREAVIESLRGVHGRAYDTYSSALVERHGLEAARHLFRVAAGLESPLLGESQVLGQLRTAVREARLAGCLDHVVGGTADQAVAAARLARRESGLGRGAASLGQAAVHLLRDQAGGVRGRRVLVVGAGEVGGLAARALARAGAELLIGSRSGTTAEALSRSVGATPVDMDRMPELLRHVDAAVLSAGTGAPLVHVRDLSGRDRPLLLLDLAVPRNVEAAAGRIPGVRLVNVDELGAQAQGGLSRRQEAARKAGQILEQELAAWRVWFRSTSANPTLAALAEYADGIRSRELQRTLRTLGELDPSVRRRIESLSRALVSRLMFHPIAYVRAHPEDEAARELLQRMFSEPPA